LSSDSGQGLLIPNPKTSQHIEKSSSIHNALKLSSIPGKTAPGLLKYFKKATSQERQESIMRDFEELKFKQDNNKWIEEQSVFQEQHAKRKKAREWKRNEHTRKQM
jgi:Sec-independent protein translocase protein TatA